MNGSLSVAIVSTSSRAVYSLTDARQRFVGAFGTRVCYLLAVSVYMEVICRMSSLHR